MHKLVKASMKQGQAMLVAASLAAVFPATAYANDSYGGVIHACVQRKSGEVRIVGSSRACRHNEAAMVWPAGPQGPQADPGAGARTVVDSAGQTVGTLLDCCSVVAQDADGDFVILPMTNAGFVSSGGNLTFFYESFDCSGPRLLPQRGLFSTVLIDGTTAYYATGFRAVTANSQLFFGSCAGTRRSFQAGEVHQTDLSVFTPPFSVQ